MKHFNTKHCKNCNCDLQSEHAFEHHLHEIHNIRVRIKNEEEATCLECLSCLKDTEHDSFNSLEKHLRKKHFIDIQG